MMDLKETLFHETAANIDNALKGQLFGKQCYKLNGKAFCCFFQNEMVFKLSGDAHSKALSLDGSQLFDPSGKSRPMKEWVQVPFDYKNLWSELAQDAATYIQTK